MMDLVRGLSRGSLRGRAMAVMGRATDLRIAFMTITTRIVAMDSTSETGVTIPPAMVNMGRWKTGGLVTLIVEVTIIDQQD
jgi:hypothetical protein